MSDNFAPQCLSIDLEIGKKDLRIHSFGAVRGDNGLSIRFDRGDLDKALDRLDELADEAAFLLGHNLILFDLPHLKMARPDLRLHGKPVVDTLWLNPLAFPQNPYHYLVKHYQDGRLQGGHLNDPVQDAQLALELFRDQHRALKALQASNPDLLTAWHWLSTQDDTVSGVNRFFVTLRNQLRPSSIEARAAIASCLEGKACIRQQHLDEAAPWPLAYALAWLSVSGGNSVMPPWVSHQFPETGEIIRQLRDTPCTDSCCLWCREHHDAKKQLARWFGYPEFRPEPKDPATGQPLQQKIVEAAMAGRHVLGILPTGTGKSLCYQIPALCRFENTGALTVVISPLVALMADQVAGLAKHPGVCAALNSLLSLPERADVLDRVRLGDIGILIVSPEQLRNRSLRHVLDQREIASWVLDEAHCISKWGHDFRPDYRYVGRFIKVKAGDGRVPPVLCLTATAKPDVLADILDYFASKVGITLHCFDGGARRDNLDFAVMPTTPAAKFAHIYQLITAHLPPETSGGAIVYCATRKQTEEIAAFLKQKGLAACHFHAGLSPETKKTIQQAFIGGELRVMAATNAFGMGIDKPDVRLVIHADIPGSLENYLQEAGRAGRDRSPACCVLLYTPEDVERQFGMSARSRLTRKEIQGILRCLRNLDKKKRKNGKGEVIATPGEILAEDEDATFCRDSTTDDTRVRTAVSWLEEAQLLTREENLVQIFPSSLRVASLEEARRKLSGKPISGAYQQQLLAIIGALIAADPDEGVSTDELMGIARLSSEQIRAAFIDLERLGLAGNDTALTAYVHIGVEHASSKRLEAAATLEEALIKELRENAPDLGKGECSILMLRIISQHLKDQGYAAAHPEALRRLLKSLSVDGRDEANNSGSISLKRVDDESVSITLNREWQALARTAQLRRSAAACLLDHLTGSLPVGSKGVDLLAQTTMGKLLAALDADLLLKSEIKNRQKCLDHALLWLHEQEIIRLNKGLAVFRSAMTIRLDDNWKNQFSQAEFAPLQLHYHEQVIQIHVMAEYVQRGLTAIADALHLTMDYFSLEQEEFLHRWLPDREKELTRQTTPESWRRIVEDLHNKDQQAIVSDDRETTNVLVLAGPGSGKTRVLVHRIAYLVRVRRENPHGIVALAYNRHAAVQIRQRLRDLIGDDACFVTVLTLHGLAMRLAGASFAERATGDDDFKKLLCDAAALLRGDGLPGVEADLQRDRLLAGFRWILVDEYQDIDEAMYDLISALAGRTRTDEDGKINLFAVGDDDQNIYGFKGASVGFIRRFEADYQAKPVYLIENYRSTANIIAAANALIAPAKNRMKEAHPIRMDKGRRKALPGGQWQKLDVTGRGRVQMLPAGNAEITQAIAVMAELERLAGLDPEWDWTRCAVIAREWKWLYPLRCYCEWRGIPVQMAREDNFHFWRLRETQALLAWLKPKTLIDAAQLGEFAAAQADSPGWDMLRDAIAEYALETGGSELPVAHFKDWLAEWGREARRRQAGLLLVSAHRAKGLEFDHVAVLDGNWYTERNEDFDAVRRLYYVAMTRARKTLTLARLDAGNPLLDGLPDMPGLLRRQPGQIATPEVRLNLQYVQPSLKEINLGYAGRFEPAHPLHGRIARVAYGSPLDLQEVDGAWYLLDGQGQKVGKMASSFTPPRGMQCVAARVDAIVVWRHDADAKYAEPKCAQWEVVVPELVFA